MRENIEKLCDEFRASRGEAPAIHHCECGGTPRLMRIIDSRFGLRVVGCPECRTLGPARMADIDAVNGWNSGHRFTPRDEIW
jgi:hypothetical protein